MSSDLYSPTLIYVQVGRFQMQDDVAGKSKNILWGTFHLALHAII